VDSFQNSIILHNNPSHFFGVKRYIERNGVKEAFVMKLSEMPPHLIYAGTALLIAVLFIVFWAWRDIAGF